MPTCSRQRAPFMLDCDLREGPLLQGVAAMAQNLVSFRYKPYKSKELGSWSKISLIITLNSFLFLAYYFLSLNRSREEWFEMENAS